VNLRLLDPESEERVEHVVYGQPYKLRADISEPDGKKRNALYAEKLRASEIKFSPFFPFWLAP